MLFDASKDICIISHPRSGSFWFQSCLPHYDCRETFNTVNFNIKRADSNRLVLTPFFDRKLDKSEEDEEIEKRITLLEQITTPKSVKILTFQFQYAQRHNYNTTVFDWVNRQNTNVVWMKRRDRVASLHSLLVADALSTYIGPYSRKDVTIDLKRLPWLIDSLTYEKDAFIKQRIKHPISYVFYEDLLVDRSFDKTRSLMQRQHTESVAINNWNDVVNSLSYEVRCEYGL